MRHVPDKAILAALIRHRGHYPTVAAELNVPLRRVVRIDTGGHSAHDPARPTLERRWSNLHPDEAKLEGAYGPYWRAFGLAAVQAPKPRRTVQIVPDDRDSWDFEELVDTTATALDRAGRDEGRGAA